MESALTFLFLLIFYDFSRVDCGYVWMKITISGFIDSGLMTSNQMSMTLGDSRPQLRRRSFYFIEIATIMKISLSSFFYWITLDTISSHMNLSRRIKDSFIGNDFLRPSMARRRRHFQYELFAHEIYCFNIPTV